MTARYKYTTSQNLRNLLSQAIRTVLKVHSPLSFGLDQIDPKLPPVSIRLKEIGLDDVVQFHDVDVGDGFSTEDTEEKLDHLLEERLNIEHAKIWTESPSKPLWRCVVLNYRSASFAEPTTNPT